MTATLPDALRPIRDRFLVALAERDAAVRAALASIEAGVRDDAAMEAARYAVHKTAGTAKTLGFPELGAAARACDDVLLTLRPGAERTEVAGLMRDFLKESTTLLSAHRVQ